MQLKFVKKKWHEIKSGELIKVLKDEEFPADLVLLKSDKQTGIAFVDTMNLDGEVKIITYNI
jgi:magnesium-transporting ATPase (P-type)